MLKIVIIILTLIGFIVFISIGNKLKSPSYIDSYNYSSSKFNVRKSYNFYKEHYLLKDGRVIDSTRNYITTSEGQAYILYMSVALKDKETFDLVYNWTKGHLKRKDGLHSWLWGKDQGGKYKVLDDNSATDAENDLARALILAYETWGDKKYLNYALDIINGIWDKETRQIDGHLVLMPGVNQASSNFIEINPSYFAPYAYKVFKKYDPKHDWNKLIESSYYYLNVVTSKTKTGLPPNWFLIKNGQIILEDSERSDFSYDAIRVFWRIYFDYRITGDKRAIPILEKSKFFIKQWKKTKTLYVNYNKNGVLADQTKLVGAIAILLPSIALFDNKTAEEIYKKEVSPYINMDGFWEKEHEYYSQNLLWVGQYIYMYRKDF